MQPGIKHSSGDLCLLRLYDLAKPLVYILSQAAIFLHGYIRHVHDIMKRWRGKREIWKYVLNFREEKEKKMFFLKVQEKKGNMQSFPRFREEK